MPNITWDRRRMTKTAVGGGLGFLAGTVVEHLIEGVTGLNIADGLLEVVGTVAGMARANADILPELLDQVRAMFGKEPGGLTKQEWDEFCRRYPQYADTVKRYAEL